MNWIDRREQDIPFDIDVLAIWKGRVGILQRIVENGKEEVYFSYNPAEFVRSVPLDDICMKKVHFWMPLPDPKFRSDL